MKHFLAFFGLTLLLAGGVAGQDTEQNYNDLYESGSTYDEFLADATARKEMWTSNTDLARKLVEESAEFVDRVEAQNGAFRMLVVAVDGCSDSANTIPYLALLASSARNLDLRIVHPDLGRSIMEDNRTPDGRAATPTVLLMDEEGLFLGAFVERPAALQDWAIAKKSSMRSRDFMREKFAWYREDGGRSTVAEMVALIESAAG